MKHTPDRHLAAVPSAPTITDAVITSLIGEAAAQSMLDRSTHWDPRDDTVIHSDHVTPEQIDEFDQAQYESVTFMAATRGMEADWIAVTVTVAGRPFPVMFTGSAWACGCNADARLLCLHIATVLKLLDRNDPPEALAELTVRNRHQIAKHREALGW